MKINERVVNMISLIRRQSLASAVDDALEFAVIDEFGSEHRLSIDGDKKQLTFILDQSKRSMKRLV